MGAGLGIYHAIDDEEASSRVICAAASDDQAGLLFTAAQRICDWSDSLSKFSTVKDKGIEFNTGDGAPSELKKVAAAAGTNDGKNLAAVFIDELHEWVQPKHRSVFTVLTQGGGARRQPINVMITTAGSDQDSICYELYEHGQLIMAGEVEDDAFYCLWFQAPEGADYRDPKTWEAANPSWGLILKEEFYRDIITKRTESEFCRYFLNMWVEQDEIWEAASYWDALGECELRADLPTYVGIDVGRRHDTAAVVACQWTGEKLLVRTRFWVNPYKRADPRHGKWALTIAEVEQYLRDLYAEFPEPAVTDEEDGYRMPGPAYVFDPHFFVRSAELLEGDGLSMVEFPQTDAKMVPASQQLFQLIKVGQVEHDHNLRMRSHMRSVQAKQKERGWRIAKPDGSTKPIDGAVALAMAAYAASCEFQEEDEAFNIW